MRVTVVSDPALVPEERRAVRGARLGPLLRGCGDALGVAPRIGFTLRLARDAELIALNGGFRGEDRPTDVLAFPAGERDYLGDVAVSVERALAQADDGVAELRLLAVHGLLHCLGHDHHDSEEAARMTAETRRLLPDQDVPELVPATGSA